MNDDLLRARQLLGNDLETVRSDIKEESKAAKADKKVNWLDSFLNNLPLFPEQTFKYAGYPVNKRKEYLFLFFAVFFVTLLLAFITGIPYLLVLPVIIFFLQNWSLNSKVKKRADDFDKDYAALLLSLSSGLKAGLDPLSALAKSDQLFPPTTVIHQELSSFNTELQSGSSEDQALLKFGSQIDHPDVRLFHMSFRLARKEGASLAHCLQRLARVTRQRQSFRRKVRAAVAMQKLSAFGIAGCAFAIGVIQAISSGNALQEAISLPFGRILIGTGILLMSFGIIWMLNMAKLKV